MLCVLYNIVFALEIVDIYNDDYLCVFVYDTWL